MIIIIFLLLIILIAAIPVKRNAIKLDNITLEPITTRYKKYIEIMMTNPELMKFYTMDGKPWTQKRIDEYMDNNSDYAIIIDDQFVGLTGIAYDSAAADNQSFSGNFIHIIISADHQNKGIASKVIPMIYNTTSGILYSKIHPDNHASIRIHEKNGFVYVGRGKYNIYQKTI